MMNRIIKGFSSISKVGLFIIRRVLAGAVVAVTVMVVILAIVLLGIVIVNNAHISIPIVAVIIFFFICCSDLI